MTYNVKVASYQDWLEAARAYLYADIVPELITWTDNHIEQKDLFSSAQSLPAKKCSVVYSIPKQFLALIKLVSAHSAVEKWALLYQALWRITHGEKFLFSLQHDALVRKLALMEKAVRRDMHKMKAFVRFKAISHEDETHYIAWHEPDHNIAALVAPFFQRRFNDMCWTIMTSLQTIQWDQQQLHFLPGVAIPEKYTDENEMLWKIYYASIFNPARVKIKAMKKEMPVRYWKNMPEAELIPQLISSAGARVESMTEHVEGYQGAQAYLPKSWDLSALQQAAAGCQGCDLYKCATQTVFGNGPLRASIMFVGEQPGDKEDINGQAFIGPAGQLLNELIKQANLDSSDAYYTNVVKHFKFSWKGNLRLHRSPNIHEVNACKPWLQAEIIAVQPKLIICLGLTAAKALISHGFQIKTQHGKLFRVEGLPPIIATYHPSAILRASGENKMEQQQALLDDFILAKQLIDSF